MMVTFVSECEKNSLNKTRRVLDAFANRIGSRTWQTVITDEGLRAVKKLLRQTASKNTAVSCHWIRSRSRSELVWIVGNRRKFNHEGGVPVNLTQKDLLKTQWENDWEYLPLIGSLTALAALFHDWGKASELFQAKLKPESKQKFKGDPLRHEWISALFFNAYVSGESDESWLGRLAEGKISAKVVKDLVVHQHHKMGVKNRPLKGLANGASLIAWLIVSHHRLPSVDANRGKPASDFSKVFKKVAQNWGYENRFDEEEFERNLKRCFDYSEGLPSDSKQWLRYAKRSAKKLLDCLPLLEKSLEEGSWRVILHHARLALMLGDHHYSSLGADPKWRSDLNLYANTDRETKALKQKLDEHLVGVAKQAVRTVHLLPAFEGNHAELQKAYDIKALKKSSPSAFRWQDIAVRKIIEWREQNNRLLDQHQFGFFSVNMASTGKGKTFANAKIMRALSPDKESLRYILALGLRTLTLQTGDEYRERIKLENDELAVLIGSRAVLDLHNKNRQEVLEEPEEVSGSESQQSLLDNELVFEASIPESDLKTVLESKKNRQFLYAPVLSCTIDHLMAATETKRGGRYILPSLRLMSSDLVIDEIDDFDGEDLIAIGRLIHLTGMLGRKVMISSATIPPDLAQGYFNSYQEGWRLFAKMRGRSTLVGCAWVDEFATQVVSLNVEEIELARASYEAEHERFVTQRIAHLGKERAKRRADIVACELALIEGQEEEGLRESFFSNIQTAVLKKHQDHHEVDQKTGKQVSLGVVRMANIAPCIELTRFLLNADWPDGVEVRVMAYHSQQILLMRSEQEKHLDQVLKRKEDSPVIFDHAVIRAHLTDIKAKNVIFILVATPVEEVGRDHDFDWAVVEPSSFRSFIQLAGRVLRHREQSEPLCSSNIALLQYNLKGVLFQAQNKDKPVFCRPGYESEHHRLQSHDLRQLVDENKLAERLDAELRISKKERPDPFNNLADLEHEVIHTLLTNYEQSGPESMQGWLSSCWWLTGIPQQLVRFRRSAPQLTVFRVPDEDATEWVFVEKGRYGQPNSKIEKTYGIKIDENLTEREQGRLWLRRDYPQLLEGLGRTSLEKAALIYGEINLPTYGKDSNDLSFHYSSQFGLVAK